MHSLYFKFNDKYYQQINGLPIGLSVSPILADLVIQDIEETVMKSFKKYIYFYGRFVDDSYILVNKDKLDLVFNSFNSVNNRINFTCELEKEQKLNFLDILVIKNEDSSITFDIYKKPTFSGRYVNYFSNHSIGVKIGIIKNLVDKIYKLADKKFHAKNLEIIRKELKLNSYPEKFIDRHLKNHLNKLEKYHQTERNNYEWNNLIISNKNQLTYREKYKHTFVLPRIDCLTEKIKGILKKKYKKHTIFRNPFKLNNLIRLGKDNLEKTNNKNIIYQIDCKSCEKNYVGQSSRLLKTRSDEHKNNINLNPKYHNVITKHIL